MQTFSNIIRHFNELGIDYYSGVEKAIRHKGWQKSSVKVGKLEKHHEFVGLIFKEEGIFIDDKMLLCVDIDAKIQYGNTLAEQQELFKSVCSILNIDPFYQGIEQTLNGGYHIFLLVDKKEAENLKNSSVVVEFQECGKKPKKEIEIFVNGRYIVNAPSKGYRGARGEHIDFNRLNTTTFESLEQLKTMSCVVEYDKNFEEVEFNTGKTDTYLNKAFSNIPELKKFKDGEWLGYNETKNEIMRFFISLNQEQEFLNIINQKWSSFFKNWCNFPSKYLEATGGNRAPSKFSKHIEWLKKVGALKTQSKKDDLVEKMDSVFKAIAGTNTLRVGDSTFIYNGKSFEWLSPLDYDKMIYSEYKKQAGKILKKEEMSELIFHFSMYLYENGLVYNPADKLEKPKTINIAFQNGTLYVTEKERIFKENHFSADDKVFIEMAIDYKITNEKGLLNEWVEKRFKTDEKIKFFRMIIGDLFSTNANTDVHGYFWGGAEIGKSTFASLLQKITTKGTVDFMKLDKIKDKFSRVRTLRTPIMIADESSERNIPESEYKSIISREPDDYEMKNVQNFNGQPIAKFLTFANILPNIKMDEGVKRRLCVLQVDSCRVAEHLGKQEFAEEFGKCENEAVNFILDGIQECFEENWDLSGYYKNNFKQEQSVTIFTNDNFSYFISQCFETTTDTDKVFGVTSMGAFTVYNQFLNTLEGTAISKMSVTKFGMKLRELGIDNKKFKIDGKTKRLLSKLKHTEKSLELMLKEFADEKSLEHQSIRVLLTKLKKEKDTL